MKMDYQTKSMIVDALTKLVEEAPTKSAVPYTLQPNPYVISKERFDIWTNYIFSVLQIISSYVDISICVTNINSIIMQPKLNDKYEYAAQVNSICHIILDFAQKILYL